MLISATAFEAVGNFTSHRVSCGRVVIMLRARKGGLLQVLPLERTLSMLAVASIEAGSILPVLEPFTVQSARVNHASDGGRSRRVNAAVRLPLRRSVR